jgi:hypothetical protein
MPRLKPRAKTSPALLIGWRERVKLPRLGIGTIIAKVDTGARSAALHAEEIEQHGARVHFRVRVNDRDHACEGTLVGRRRVKSSSGHRETRMVIETDVLIGANRFPIEVTLTDRTDMGVPMLLGRAAMRGRFVVDPARSFIISRRKRKTRTS